MKQARIAEAIATAVRRDLVQVIAELPKIPETRPGRRVPHRRRGASRDRGAGQAGGPADAQSDDTHPTGGAERRLPVLR